MEQDDNPIPFSDEQLLIQYEIAVEQLDAKSAARTVAIDAHSAAHDAYIRAITALKRLGDGRSTVLLPLPHGGHIVLNFYTTTGIPLVQHFLADGRVK